jgi:hypothetical protein
MKGQGKFSQGRAVNVSDQKTTYLLPCSCGREIPIELRHAGETVRCACGRTCTAPTLRDIRNLRPALPADATPAAARPGWGNSQRFLVAGLAVLLLAALAAAILYEQFPPHFAGLPSPEAVRERIKQMSLQDTRAYFHRAIEPGIEISEGPVVDRERSMADLGMAAVGGVAAVGLILVGIGVALRVGGRASRGISAAP